MATNQDPITGILRDRCGQWSVVELRNGKQLRVFDIAWGRDMGDDFDHITTNISPGPAGEPTIDFFFTTEVTRIADEATGTTLFVG